MWIEVRCGEQCLFILFVLSVKSIGILNSEISKSAFIHQGRSSIIFGLCLCRKISKPLERNAQKTISSVNIVDMSKILGKHVHSVKIGRNLIRVITFFRKKLGELLIFFETFAPLSFFVLWLHWPSERDWLLETSSIISSICASSSSCSSGG